MEASAPDIPNGEQSTAIVGGGDLKLAGDQNLSGANGAELKPPTGGGKIETVEDAQRALSFQCGLCDRQIIYKMAQELLSGLATACADSTTGGIFKTPATVAVEIRKEMVDYLRTRSEYFLAESMVMEGDSEAAIPGHPFDIISTFIDDFALQKRNIFSRVSGWVLSDMREDKIDDFVQQMEMNSFWVLDRRETVTEALLRNVDFKNQYHCKMRFASEEELQEHQRRCDFRSVMCKNEGCSCTFSAKQAEKHDSNCPFKLLQCEQGCQEYLLRREMDRHCVPVCSMRITTCTFYSIGCQDQVPQCKIKQHCIESRHTHLVNVLKFIHKDASEEDAQLWAKKIENSEFCDQLEATDVRSFARAVKDVESRIGPFKIQKNNEPSEQAFADSPRPKQIAMDLSPDQAMKDPPPPGQASEDFCVLQRALQDSREPTESSKDHLILEPASNDHHTLQASVDALRPEQVSKNSPPSQQASEDLSLLKQTSEDPSLLKQTSEDPSLSKQTSDNLAAEAPGLSDPPLFEQASKGLPQQEQTYSFSPSANPKQAPEGLQQLEPPTNNNLTPEKPTTDSPQPEQASVVQRQPEHAQRDPTPL